MCATTPDRSTKMAARPLNMARTLPPLWCRPHLSALLFFGDVGLARALCNLHLDVVRCLSERRPQSRGVLRFTIELEHLYNAGRARHIAGVLQLRDDCTHHTVERLIVVTDDDWQQVELFLVGQRANPARDAQSDCLI